MKNCLANDALPNLSLADLSVPSSRMYRQFHSYSFHPVCESMDREETAVQSDGMSNMICFA